MHKILVIAFIIFAFAIVALSVTLMGGYVEERSEYKNLIQDGKTGEEIQGQLTLADLEKGCPRQDCIPSIDDSKFETASEADTWLRDQDLVFGIEYKGEVRAYPQRILNWHEIVNDIIAGDPVAITFCPLCGSAIAFERVLDGEPVEFGVSGRLYNSNLVMYDRSQEKSYWHQATGEAVIGPKTGSKLNRVLMAPSRWSNWLEEHPDTKVLSRDTGFKRDYDHYPYGAYEENGEVWFGLENSDERLPIKEIVYGFDVEGSFKAYSLSILEKNKIINDIINNKNVKVELKADGKVSLTDIESGQVYVPLRTFWFAWAAFHSQTEIYQEN